MNIDQIPDGPIKPTKLPKIVLDQHKEAYFKAGQTAPQSNQNPNAQPNKGGLIANLDKYIQEANVKAEAERNKQRVRQTQSRTNFGKVFDARTMRSRTKKKGNPAFAIIAVVIWFGFGIVGSISDSVSESGFEFDTDSSDSSLVVEPIDPANVTYVTQTTDCYTIDLPDYSRYRESGDNCEISFTEGFTLTRSAFVSFTGDFFYEDADEYLENRGGTVEIIDVNGRKVHKITPESEFSSVEYFFWVRDLELDAGDGEIIESISFYITQTSTGSDDDIKDMIIDSISFGADSQLSP